MTQANTEFFEEDELSLVDLLIVLAKNRRLILGLPLIVGVLAAVVVLLIPSKYTASARILPPVIGQSTTLALLGSMGGGIMGVGKNPSDIYVTMIKSRSVEDELIKNFDLQAYYDKRYKVDTRKAFEKDLSVKAGKEGVIEIEYEHRDPVKAAAVANGVVGALKDLNARLAITEAARRRVYFEHQLALAKDHLSESEVSLKGYQEKTGVMEMDAQGSATLSQIATLEATVAAKEVQLAGMRSFATKNNPDYQRVQNELAGLRAELSKLQGSSRPTRGVMVSKDKMPEQGLEFAHRKRDVKYYETLYEIMARQYEMAKADEAKEGALIQVVDEATPPEKRSFPKRTMTVLLAMVVALFMAILLAFLRNAIAAGGNDPRQAARMAELKRALGR